MALAGLVGWNLATVIAVSPAIHLHILMASSLTLLAATANALAARVQAMGLFATALASTIMLTSSSVMALLYGNDAKVAAGTMACMALVTTFLPTLSYQIAGIALPNLPVTTEAMLADETPVQSDIVRRALFADRLLGGMLAGTTNAAMLSTPITMAGRTWWAVALAICVGLAFLLRARAFVGFTQRLALVTGGGLITALGVVANASVVAGSLVGLGVLVGVTILVSYLFAHYSASWHRKILSPTWGRWGNVFEWLAIIGIVPFMLGVLDFYVWFRSLFNF